MRQQQLTENFRRENIGRHEGVGEGGPAHRTGSQDNEQLLGW